MLHVLVGENAARETWEDHARRGQPISWIVPKSAEPGDEALFVFNRDQFIGMGTIASEPESATFLGQAAYRADVRDLSQFNRNLAVEVVGDRIPEWKWPASYTKGRTTPADAIARKLDRIVREHVERVGLVSVKRAPKPAPGNKRKRQAGGRTNRNSSEPKDLKLSGPQIEAVIREQTGGVVLGAEGRKFLRTHIVTERNARNRKYILELRADRGALSCDACGTEPSRRYGPEHAAVLELHHRIPLSRGAQRPRGTEAFALLCPTCHRVVHYRREDPLDVDVLRARLRA